MLPLASPLLVRSADRYRQGRAERSQWCIVIPCSFRCRIGRSMMTTTATSDLAGIDDAIAPLMPKPGEDVSSASDVFANVYGHCLELAAGRAAEQMLLGDDDTRSASDDLRQARELARLICTSEEAIAA